MQNAKKLLFLLNSGIRFAIMLYVKNILFLGESKEKAMKKTNLILKLLSLLTLTAVLVIGLAACVGEESAKGSDDENLCLVYEGDVNFQIVTSSMLDIKAKKQVTDLIAELSELGLDLPAEPVSDSDAEAVKKCEIIFGTDVLNREGCAVDVHEFGEDGYTIRIVGDRIIVAAGSNEALEEVIGIFKKKVMGITNKTETLEGETIKVERKYKADRGTEYPIASVQIGNESIGNFYLSYDAQNVHVKAVVNKLRQTIYEKCGFWLKLESDLAEGQTAEHKFIIRLATDLGEDNFKVYVSGNDFIIECTSDERMQKGVDAYVAKYFNEKLTASRFHATDVFVYDAVALRYSEFGAKGDGKTDDFVAIAQTHSAANIKGVKVMADEGATYYIGNSSHGKTIQARTDVDWGNAKFIVDDSEITPHSGNRGYRLFEFSSSNQPKIYKTEDGTLDGNNITLSIGDTSLPDALKSLVDKRCMIIVYNSDHKIYVRYGDNASESQRQPQHESLIVNADGTIDVSETPVMWNYSKLTEVRVYDINDEPLTIEGGTFVTYANQVYNGFTQADLDNGWLRGNQYYYYGRGISIARSNVTVRNITHNIEREGSEGYPYDGWFGTSYCYNVTYENLVLTGHRKYVENRPNGRGTPMGSYEINVNSGVSVTYKNCRQTNSITDDKFWGVMCSNFSRNLTYDGCMLSRFDAHEGVYNATIKNSTLGYAFNLVGAGLATIENTVKMGGSSFVDFRGDYGSLWRGDIIIKNCSMKGNAAVIMSGQWLDEWKGWDFGYDIYMPQNITIENFTAESSATLALFNAGSGNYGQLSADDIEYITPPKTVTIKNQTRVIDLALPYLKSIINNGLTVTEEYVN